MVPCARTHQSATSICSAIILVVLLMLPLTCASTGQQRRINKVKEEVEATWVLEEWHIAGQAVRPPKVEGRFVIRDNAFVLILLNRSSVPPWSYYGYGKYALDASTFSMGFDEEEVFVEKASGITVSREPTWEGMKPFGIDMENNQVHLLSDDGSTELIIDGNTLIIERKGEIARTYRRAGAD